MCRCADAWWIIRFTDSLLHLLHLRHQLLAQLFFGRCSTCRPYVLSRRHLSVLTMRSGSRGDIHVLVLSVAPHTQLGDLTGFQCRHCG